MATRFAEDSEADASDTKAQTLFSHAVSLDEEELQAYLAETCLDINTTDRDGSSALILAADCGNLIAISRLVACGADVNARSGSRSALMAAAEGGHEVCFDVLIRAGARINDQDAQGRTPLMMATIHRQVESVKALLKAGASINMTDSLGMSALSHAARLMSACTRDDQWFVQRSAGLASADRQNAPGFLQPEYLSELSENTLEITSALLHAEANPDLADEEGLTPLIHLNAYKFGNSYIARRSLQDSVIKCCQLLMSHKADVNIRDKTGMTALMYASRNNMASCCELLLQHNAQINLQDRKGRTALTHAFISDSLDSFSSLVAAGASTLDDNGRTHLMYAFLFQAKSITLHLLDKDPDVNIQDRDGRTALMYAVLHNSPLLSDLIKRQDIDWSLQDKDGRTSVIYATNNDTLRLLRSVANAESWPESVMSTALVPFLKDISFIEKCHGDLGYQYQLKVCHMMENGTSPFVHPRDRPLLNAMLPQSDHVHDIRRLEGEMFCMGNFITHGRRPLIQLFVCNGLVETFHKDNSNLDKACSPVSLALYYDLLDVVRYFMANRYLVEDDIKAIRRVAREGRDSRRQSFKASIDVSILQEAVSQPWPLVKLAFIAVSSALGGGPDRPTRISQTQLPARLQNMLMFQEPVSLLPVSQWADIPLCFDPVEYETLPKPRPLLYYWPIGRDMVKDSEDQ